MAISILLQNYYYITDLLLLALNLSVLIDADVLLIEVFKIMYNSFLRHVDRSYFVFQ